MTNLRKVWADTLKKAGVPYFAPYELRNTSPPRSTRAASPITRRRRCCGRATRVSKPHGQAKLGMLREELAKLDRKANERFPGTQNVN